MLRTLTPFFSFIIAILLYVFFTSPNSDSISSLEKDIQDYREVVDAHNEFQSKLSEKMSAIKARSQSENERLNRLVPDAVDSARLVVDLSHMAESKGLLFGNVVTEDAALAIAPSAKKEKNVKGSEFSTVDISFEIIGTYDQFKAFLVDLENSLTIYEVTNLAFTATADQLNQFAITVRAYALPETE